MLWDEKIATVYRVENGFVVECREEKKKKEPKPTGGCCAPDSFETKTYTAANSAAVMKIIREKMGEVDDKEYATTFDAAAKSK